MPVTPSPLSLIEDADAETVAGGTQDTVDDSLSILSRVSYPDPLGRRDLLIPSNEPAKPAYEAWELVKGEDTIVPTTWKTICGIRIGVEWKSLGNGFTEINPQSGYDQEELANLHLDAIREHEARSSKNKKSYAQDLANRVFGLEADVYDRIQLLVDDKTKATNSTPYRRREWRIVMLKEGEFRMTELLPERRKRFFHRQAPAVRRLFIILRGEEVKTSKEDEGWQQFGRHTNPWCRVDMQETRTARRDHRDYFERIGQKFGARRGSISRNEMNVRVTN
ncbi:hypothetical protein F5B19DRAFT_490573 [Rostrohypoxylon terebratum]|nr:hypothetical protein F5B19DRAFT_490573 [Rostrohypoxylon terebratum]